MPGDRLGLNLQRCYRALLDTYGPQGWWPGEGPFEVMVGAVLTQNTAWRNAERALENLKEAGVLSPAGLQDLAEEDLAHLIRPAGYFRVKARRLRALVDYLQRAHDGDPAGLARGELGTLRQELLAVKGIGPETADGILLYAGGQSTFVVDAYTRRLLARLGQGIGLPVGFDPHRASYVQIQRFLTAHLPADPALYNEFHALIVRHAKERCHKRGPRCEGCPLLPWCGHRPSP